MVFICVWIGPAQAPIGEEDNNPKEEDEGQHGKMEPNLELDRHQPGGPVEE